MADCYQCSNDPCTCPRASSIPSTRSTYTPRPLGITKAEFGLALYDTIQMIGGIRELKVLMDAAVAQGEGYKLQGYLQRQYALRDGLPAQLAACTASERQQLQARYPEEVR